MGERGELVRVLGAALRKVNHTHLTAQMGHRSVVAFGATDRAIGHAAAVAAAGGRESLEGGQGATAAAAASSTTVAAPRRAVAVLQHGAVVSIDWR